MEELPATKGIPVERCFLSGTLISTLQGARPVETLTIGDLVITESHGALPVKWIGKRDYLGKLLHRYDLQHLMPICVAANALADGNPARDLFLSPEHRIRIGDVLIAAENLTNAMSITRCNIEGPIRYFHLELPRHSVVYANGSPVESFVMSEIADYAKFTNILEDPPRAAAHGNAYAAFCLPVVGAGELLDRVHDQLAARAGQLGFATTPDADLHLTVDGTRISPEDDSETLVRFSVSGGAGEVRIRSRSVAPAEVIRNVVDRRRLGVRLTGLLLRNAHACIEIAPDYRHFDTGFHDVEGDEHQWRWTDGSALVPPRLIEMMRSDFTLELKISSTGLLYPTTVPAPPQ